MKMISEMYDLLDDMKYQLIKELNLHAYGAEIVNEMLDVYKTEFEELIRRHNDSGDDGV